METMGIGIASAEAFASSHNVDVLLVSLTVALVAVIAAGMGAISRRSADRRLQRIAKRVDDLEQLLQEFGHMKTEDCFLKSSAQVEHSRKRHSWIPADAIAHRKRCATSRRRSEARRGSRVATA